MIATIALAALIAGPDAAAAPAMASHQAPAAETRIRNMTAYIEAVADPRRGVYIQDYAGHWYYARVESDCARLTRSAALRFNASPGGYFDRHSSIRADGWRCMVASVVRSGAPPRR